MPWHEKEGHLKRIVLLSLLMLLTLSACSLARGELPRAAPAPANSEADLEEMARLYPKEYNDWQDSVHGAAYLAGNADAPGCTDCHGDPADGHIKTAAFRLEIPARCARCHDDAQLMARYDIAADTYESYSADYHGTTVGYYRAHDTSTWRYEATCSDCHGSHAVYRVDDPQSSVAPANLLATCQKCHLGAGPGFATSAVGHFRISAATSPFIYYVGVAYQVLIPVVIGAMLAYIGLDVVHRLRHRRV